MYVEGSGWWSRKVSSFDEKDHHVLYDNGYCEDYGEKEVSQMLLPTGLEQVRVGSHVTVLWDDKELL